MGINNRSLIVRWVQDYRQKGEFAFVPRPRGRSRKEGTVAQSRLKNSKVELSELERQLAEAQKEYLYLRVKNEYLKGLRRLRMEQQMRENPDLFKASKEKSNSRFDSSSKPQD